MEGLLFAFFFFTYPQPYSKIFFYMSEIIVAHIVVRYSDLLKLYSFKEKNNHLCT